MHRKDEWKEEWEHRRTELSNKYRMLRPLRFFVLCVYPMNNTPPPLKGLKKAWKMLIFTKKKTQKQIPPKSGARVFFLPTILKIVGSPQLVQCLGKV